MVNAADPLFDPYTVAGEPSVRLAEQIRDERWFCVPEESSTSQGRRLAWAPNAAHPVLRVGPDQVIATAGNLFDPVKLATFASMIRSGDIRAAHMPMAHSDVVRIIDVEETQQARPDDLAFDGMTRPFTTGDEDLDAYLRDPDEYVEANEIYSEDVRAEMDAAKATAAAEGWGDIGTQVVRLNSGNHRAFAAFMAGEPYIFVELLDEPSGNPRAEALSW